MSGGMGSPQGWNRYSYVNGDPLNHFDPSGLFIALVAGPTIMPYLQLSGDSSSGSRAVWGTEGRDMAEAWVGDGEGSAQSAGDATDSSLLLTLAVNLAEKALDRSDCQSLFGTARTRSGAWNPTHSLAGRKARLTRT